MTASVQAGDRTITAAAHGEGEPLLLIHGAMVADAYQPMLDEHDLSCRAVTYHRRGFLGSSAATTNHTISDEVSDALAVLDHFGIDTAHVAGHSYGGAVALQMALDAPDRVHSLVLLEPALLTVPSAEAFGAAVGPIAELFQAGNHQHALLAFMELVGGPNPLDRLTHLPPAATEQALADIATLFTHDLPALSGWTIDENQLSSINKPTLTVLGAESQDIFAEGIALLEALLPNHEPFRLPGTTHFLQIEQPAPVATRVQSFLQHHPIDR